MTEMRNISTRALLIILAIAFTGCGNNKTANKPVVSPADTVTTADTGYTGIRQYFSKRILTYEVTFKNGVRNGLMKTFYSGGNLRQTFWYENGKKEDTAVWYYEEGPVFRKTPFKRDSMNGMQIQFYKSGAVRAKMSFVNGLRTTFLEEYSNDGKKITDYPDVVINVIDKHKDNGSYLIRFLLDRKDVKANFYTGDLSEGLFNPSVLRKINTSDFTGAVSLMKGPGKPLSSLSVIAEITTQLGNKRIVTKSLALPYADLVMAQ